MSNNLSKRETSSVEDNHLTKYLCVFVVLFIKVVIKIRGIYAIRNLINGKVYIGKSLYMNKRKAAHLSELRKGIHGNEPLQRSFDKHGENNFEFDVLVHDNSMSDEELYELERIYILLFNTTSHGVGYNITFGRGGIPQWTPEMRKARSIAYTGEGNPFYGRKHSEESIRKRVANTDYSYIQTPEYRKKLSEAMKGRVFSKEHSRNKSLAQMGSKNPMAVAVSIDGEISGSITEAATKLGMKRSTVHARIESDSRRFENWIYLDPKRIPYEKVVDYSKTRFVGSRKRRCLIDGKEYESVKSASEATGIHGNTIRGRIKNDNFPNYSYIEK